MEYVSDNWVQVEMLYRNQKPIVLDSSIYIGPHPGNDSNVFPQLKPSPSKLLVRPVSRISLPFRIPINRTHCTAIISSRLPAGSICLCLPDYSVRPMFRIIADLDDKYLIHRTSSWPHGWTRSGLLKQSLLMAGIRHRGTPLFLMVSPTLANKCQLVARFVSSLFRQR